MTLSNIPEMPVETVTVDRPFAFFIIHRSTKNTLFNGHIQYINTVNPVTRIQGDMMNTMSANNHETSNQQYTPSSPIHSNTYQKPLPTDKTGVYYKVE